MAERPAEIEEETSGELIEAEAETHEVPQLDRKSGRGLRFAVLMANALVVVMSGLSMLIYSFGGSASWSKTVVMVHIALTVLVYGPILVALILTVWGPQHIVVRSMYLISLILTLATLQAFSFSHLNHSTFALSGAQFSAESFFVWSLASWLNSAVPAALILAMIGSLRRLRVGPPDLPPVRTSIASIMASTAVLGVVFAVVGMLSERSAGLPTSGVAGGAEMRGSLLYSALLYGVIASLLAYTGAAAAHHWQARLAMAVLVVVSVGAARVFYGPMTNQMGVSQTGFVIAIAFTLIIALIWTPVCVRLLHHSGWEFSRR